MAIQICDVHTDQRLKEQTQHGDLLFPVACYEDDMAVDNVPMHWHEELEYILVTAGTVTVQVGTEKRTLEKGAGVLINTGVLHAVQHVPGGASVLRSLVIHPEVIGGSPHSCYWQELVVPFCGREDLPFLLLGGSRPWHGAVAALMMRAWDAIVQEADGYAIEARYALSRAMHLICGNLAACPAAPLDETLMERMKLLLDYLAAHYDEDISNQTLMRLAACSESVLLRSFRKTVGTSPMRYLTDYRLERAAAQLLATDAKVSEIAARVGFHDISYFTKCFRRATGQTPRQFRAATRQSGGR